MKNIVKITLFSLIGIHTLTAQLYVQPTATDDSYVYASDTFIFVTEDIELVENGPTASETPSIALRNQAQLLQRNSAAANKGNGVISLFQEGTTDNYHYNFWASPVGTSTDPTNPSGNGTFSMISGQEILKLPNDVLLSQTPTVNNSILDGNISGSTFNFASRWIYSYQSTTTTSGSTNASWSVIQNSAELEPGWGFSMKGVIGTDTTTAGESTPNNDNDFTNGEGQRYDFRGRPNNGTISGVTVGRDQNSLIGNPYPSALDLSYFLLENSDDGSGTATYNCAQTGTNTTITRRDVTTGVAYFWDSNPAVASHYLQDYEGGYGTFAPMGDICSGGMYMAAPFYSYDNEGGQSSGTVGSGGMYDRRFSPIGQGFFVVGSPTQPLTTGSNEILFSNRHRVYVPEGTNSEFKTNNNTNDPIPGIGVDITYDDVNNLAPLSRVYLKVGVNDTYTRELGLGLLDFATAGVDRGIDAANRGPLPTDVSFDIAGATGNEKENGFVINGVPFGEDQMIPLLVKAESLSEFKFKVSNTVDFPYSEVFLYDALTDLYHDILHDEALLLLDQDLYTERFFVRFTKNNEEETDEEQEEEEEEEETTEDSEENEETTEDQEETEENEDTTSDESEENDETEDTEDTNDDSTSEETDTSDDESESTNETDVEDDPISDEEQSPFIEESILETFTIVQNNSNRQLEIYNPQNIEVSDVTIYDLTGKKIFNEMNLGGQSEYRFPTGNLATGVYVVQFVTKSGLRKGRKISIIN